MKVSNSVTGYQSIPLFLSLVVITLSVNKQINDKERIAAGMENQNLKSLVEKCIADEE